MRKDLNKFPLDHLVRSKGGQLIIVSIKPVVGFQLEIFANWKPRSKYSYRTHSSSSYVTGRKGDVSGITYLLQQCNFAEACKWDGKSMK